MRGATILRWTGRGSFEDLESSVRGILHIEGIKAAVRRCGGSVLVEVPDPIGVATLFQHTPGISWIAVGHPADSLAGIAAKAALLAKTYIKRGHAFAVLAESTGEIATPSDVAGVVSSAILGKVRGSRINEDEPKVTFRVAVEGKRGAVGVQLRVGPGGTPVGGRTVTCLVSGGVHSSVVAWHALLSGFGVALVHAEVSDESLGRVAMLYSELSHRVDPSKLSLDVLQGGDVTDSLTGFLEKHDGPTYGGFHAEGGGMPVELLGKVEAPLFLMSEEEFERSFSTLSLKEHLAKNDWKQGGRGSTRSRSFGRERTDMHGVLDRLI